MECENPLHCIAVHQINAEIAQMHITLQKLCSTIDYVFQLSRHGNLTPIGTESAAIRQSNLVQSPENSNVEVINPEPHVIIKDEIFDHDPLDFVENDKNLFPTPTILYDQEGEIGVSPVSEFTSPVIEASVHVPRQLIKRKKKSDERNSDGVLRKKKVVKKLQPCSSQSQTTSSINQDKTTLPISDQNLSLIDQDLFTFDCNLAYKALPNLGTKKVGNRHVIVAKSWVNHRGVLKLIVKLEDGSYYQAGKDLEQKERNGSLIIPQNFLIHKTKIDVSSRRREATCILN